MPGAAGRGALGFGQECAGAVRLAARSVGVLFAAGVGIARGGARQPGAPRINTLILDGYIAAFIRGAASRGGDDDLLDGADGGIDAEIRVRRVGDPTGAIALRSGDAPAVLDQPGRLGVVIADERDRVSAAFDPAGVRIDVPRTGARPKRIEIGPDREADPNRPAYQSRFQCGNARTDQVPGSDAPIGRRGRGTRAIDLIPTRGRITIARPRIVVVAVVVCESGFSDRVVIFEEGENSAVSAAATLIPNAIGRVHVDVAGDGILLRKIERRRSARLDRHRLDDRDAREGPATAAILLIFRGCDDPRVAPVEAPRERRRDFDRDRVLVGQVFG